MRGSHQAEAMTRDDLVEALASAIANGEYSLREPLPSYRGLAARHNATVRQVRNAMSVLERRGLVVRRERRGVFVRSRPEAPTDPHGSGVRCITFIEDFWPAAPQYEFVIRDYLAAYTEVLEEYDVRQRFVQFNADMTDYARFLADRVPFAEQACLLVNVTPAEFMRWLGERGIPFAVQSYYHYSADGLPPHHTAYTNRAGGALRVTQHLIELGHRRIAFIGAVPGPDLPPAVHPSLYEGYRSALRCAGMDCPARYTMDFHAADARDFDQEVVARLLCAEVRPTAIFAATDAMAVRVIATARACGLRVPEDLSVAGYNDEAGAALSDPPLTTVRDPRRELARAAVEMLVGVAAGGCEMPQTRILDGELVVRKSTAPPKA